ncbi:Sugar/inositol transporter [Corchorus olitorius]|uniref:Sugar/inositol transporter n=1 Tax=Corchorus olitorius TaxID=93759 RepID=A0A1R3J6X7_9ROSI|nr:Sugar/inositol transporter [Corchorus olitorius]
MAGGGVVSSSGGGGHDFPGSGKITLRVGLCTIVAALGGFLFGYDLGIAGGVTSMDEFLMTFFPKVYNRKHHAHEDNYCKFNDFNLQLFTSSLYLAAIVSSLIVSFFAKKLGRKIFITTASVFFLIGAILNASAQNLAMLIIGRLFLGLGLGCGNQTIPLYISEIAPAKKRGFLNICFQLLITVGILIANIVNYFFSGVNHGWRFCLGGAAIPAFILLVCSFFIVDTPASLVERNKEESGKNTLKKIRAVDNVDAEFEEIVRATGAANKTKHPYMELVFNRRNWPPLISAILIHFFQQFTGINVIMFYAPVLFQTMGLGANASLLSALITGGVNCVSTLISNFTVDRYGRRKLLILGGLIMFVGQCVVGGILKVTLKSTNAVSGGIAKFVVVMICLFVCAFAWSWGPLGWLIASEIFPLETRNAGYFSAVFVNMLCTFIIGQFFLTMLCNWRSFTFFFFAIFLALMTVFVFFLLPETKGIPIDEITDRAWKPHWFWKRFYSTSGDGFEKMEANKSDTHKPKQVQLQPLDN